MDPFSIILLQDTFLRSKKIEESSHTCQGLVLDPVKCSLIYFMILQMIALNPSMLFVCNLISSYLMLLRA